MGYLDNDGLQRFLHNIKNTYASKEYVNESLLNTDTQADFTQNDETAKDYIKNRTHYEKITNKVLLTDTVKISDYKYSENQPIINEQLTAYEYTVIWDGTEYICQALFHDDGTIYAFGNSHIYTEQNEDTGEPFYCTITSDWDNPNKTIFNFYSNNPGEHTVSVIEQVNIIKTLDPKFIEGMYYTENKTEYILPLQRISKNFDENGNGNNDGFGLTNRLNLVAGEEYIVNWNGIDYNCTAIDMREITNGIVFFCLTDVNNLEDMPNTFIIMEVSPLGAAETGFPVLITAYDGSEVIKISIKGNRKVTHHIDPEYIKDMYYSETNTNEIIPLDTYITNASMGGGDANNAVILPDTLNLIPGDKYSVLFNGEEFVVDCIDASIMDMGDQPIFKNVLYYENGDNDDNRIGFVIADFVDAAVDIVGGKSCIYIYPSASEVTISVNHSKEIIHTLDPKYIKDMYYTEVGGSGKVILPATTLEYDEYDNAFVLDNVELDLNIGENYTVSWNGTDYSTTSIDLSMIYDSSGELTAMGGKVIGLGDIYTASEGMLGTSSTGEPFAIMYMYISNEQILMSVIPIDGSTELTLAIYEGGEIIHKIDNKYLNLDWLPIIAPTRVLAAEKTVTNGLIQPTETTGGFPDLTSNNVTVGEDVLVTWDGVEYKLKVTEFGEDIDRMMVIGDPNMIATGTSMYPFLLWITGTRTNVLYKDENPHIASVMGYEYNKIPLGYLPDDLGIDIDAVPTSRKINNKALTSDITLTASDVGTLPATTITTELNKKSTATNLVNGARSGSVRGINTKAEGETYTIGEETFTYTMGQNSFAEGDSTIASGESSHAEGIGTIASGNRSHAEGSNTIASGYVSHAEGANTIASGDYASHAEGWNTEATGIYGSHAEGYDTTASGNYSHAEGHNTTAGGESSHAEGSSTIASGYVSHAEGGNTTASGNRSHAEGNNTTAGGESSHAEGSSTIASGYASHAEGYDTTASGDYSHAEGICTIASGTRQHVQGKYNIEDTTNKYAHIVGNGTSTTRSNAHTVDWNGMGWFKKGIKIGGTDQDDTNAIEIVTNLVNGSSTGSVRCVNTKAEGETYTIGEETFTYTMGQNSFAEGYNTTASGYASHAEGYKTIASGTNSHAEGGNTIASGGYSHTEGDNTIASGTNSHAEGYKTIASGTNSHAEGWSTEASGYASHAEGWNTEASGESSHAEGDNTIASGYASHAEGYKTIASGRCQHVQGKYNIEDLGYAHIVGNGTSENERSNLHIIDAIGNAWYQGDVYTGSTSGTNKDEGSKKLATEEYVNSKALPTVTSADAGKILRVSAAGEWELVSLPNAEDATF